MKKSKIGFWVIWLVLVLLGPYFITKTVVFPKIFSDYGLTLNFLERVSGVSIFTLLFIQIVLGAYMEKLSDKLGNWVYKVYTIQGPVIYLLAIVHPFFQLIFNYKLFHTLDPFYIYTQVCFLCKNKTELLYSFGRLAFWFLTLDVFAAIFKNSDGWLKKNWKKLHLFNYYIVFFLVAIHGYFLGSDFKVFPLNYFFYTSIMFVLTTVILKLSRKI